MRPRVRVGSADRLLLEAMEQGVAALSEDGVILYSNAAFARLVGRSRRRLAGMPLAQLVGERRRRELRTLLRGGGTFGRMPLPRPGRGRPLVLILTRGSSRGVARWWALLSGAAAADGGEARESSRLREDFLANVSHELNTPLAAIRGFADTLRAGGIDDPANRGRFVDGIRRHADELTSLIDELLDAKRGGSRRRAAWLGSVRRGRSPAPRRRRRRAPVRTQ